MDSNVTVNGGQISLDSKVIYPSNLPFSSENFKIIQATADYMLIKGYNLVQF